jgi:23S rRNA maturation mini-RNase III
MLKSKFVTGQSQEQIMKNLLNMGDSDEEEERPKRKGRHAKEEEK